MHTYTLKGRRISWKRKGDEGEKVKITKTHYLHVCDWQGKNKDDEKYNKKSLDDTVMNRNVIPLVSPRPLLSIAEYIHVEKHH